MSISEAVAALVESVGDLGGEGRVLAAQAQVLAEHLDSGEIPPYATPAAHRELRALIEQMGGAPAPSAGISDRELEALLAGEHGNV